MDFINVIRYVLTSELLLGGQARITPMLTPSINQRAMAKADGYYKYLPIIPASNSVQHSQIVGTLMCTAGALLAIPREVGGRNLRLAGAALSMSMSLMGVYSQARMGVSYIVPVINTTLAGIIIWGELERAD